MITKLSFADTVSSIIIITSEHLSVANNLAIAHCATRPGELVSKACAAALTINLDAWSFVAMSAILNCKYYKQAIGDIIIQSARLSYPGTSQCIWNSLLENPLNEY